MEVVRKPNLKNNRASYRFNGKARMNDPPKPGAVDDVTKRAAINCVTKNNSNNNIIILFSIYIVLYRLSESETRITS